MKLVNKLALLPVLVFLAVFVTACSHDKGNQAQPSPSTQSLDNPTVGEKIEAPLAETNVTIQNYAYTPASIEVKKGTAVRFTNLDKTGHTVTADDGSFDTPLFSDGESQTITFNQIGEFPYYCRPHSYMKGKVIVVE